MIQQIDNCIFKNPDQLINNLKEGKEELQPLTDLFHRTISLQIKENEELEEGHDLREEVEGLKAYGDFIDAKRLYFSDTIKGAVTWYFKSFITLFLFNHVFGSLPKAEKTFKEDALKIAQSAAKNHQWEQLYQLLAYLKTNRLGEEVRKGFFENFRFEDYFLVEENKLRDTPHYAAIFLDARSYVTQERERELLERSSKTGFFHIYSAVMFQPCSEDSSFFQREALGRQNFLRESNLFTNEEKGKQNKILFNAGVKNGWEWEHNGTTYNSEPYDRRLLTPYPRVERHNMDYPPGWPS